MDNKIVVTYDNESFSKQIEYVFDLIFSILGIEYKILPLSVFIKEENPQDILLISYSKEEVKRQDRQIHIASSDFFGENYLKKESLPHLPLKRWQDLPVIFGNENGIDIIASSFFMVSLYEEILSEERDKFGRFPARASLAYKEGFLSRPIVHDYIDSLWGRINSFNLGFERKRFWPGVKDLGVCLTHDIDMVQKYHFPRMFLRLKRDNPYWTFGYLSELEEKYNFKSSFYFLSSKLDGDYSITDKRIAALIRKIEGSSGEVGLHLGSRTFSNEEAMRSEKKKFDEAVENKIYGVRQHGLFWKTPDTWRIQEKLGFLYDSTLGFADYEGFRCGVCLPFKPFDVIENRTLDIWELPLILMDCTLFRSDYRNLSPSQGFDVIKNHIQTVKKYNGLLVMLWHNSSFDEKDNPGWRKVYEEALDYLSQFDSFSGTGREIINWWKSR